MITIEECLSGHRAGHGDQLLCLAMLAGDYNSVSRHLNGIASLKLGTAAAYFSRLVKIADNEINDLKYLRIGKHPCVLFALSAKGIGSACFFNKLTKLAVGLLLRLLYGITLAEKAEIYSGIGAGQSKKILIKECSA